MLDIDANTKTDLKQRESYNWVFANIKGNDVSTGEQWIKYAHPNPPKGSGFHRFVFLIFEHSSPINFKLPKIESNVLEGRNLRNTAKFAEENGLGAPTHVFMIYVKNFEG
ncbi:Phosphatidylethanolamine-binding protein 1 [Thelohanellus kitauei]|uniref:Phosphatidylethanolamine-binding protein 1 n=1 Tax=Thelohanellus kitauei TaxID=669202 RepID=A0A0C2MDD0_THEKT|nr:Phosphatidylethanolamine-binding protein 1 [Thelohanellus kitauei]